MKRSTPLKRTPLARKSPKKKRPPSTICDWPNFNCRKRADKKITATERYCNGHATAVADKLVGDFVKRRDGYTCQLVGFNDKACSGPDVFWCHLIPKGRYGSVRYEPLNAVAGCRDHHMAFDQSPIEKDSWCQDRLGFTEWHALRLTAVTTSSPKVADVIEKFRRLESAA